MGLFLLPFFSKKLLSYLGQGVPSGSVGRLFEVVALVGCAFRRSRRDYQLTRSVRSVGRSVASTAFTDRDRPRARAATDCVGLSNKL